MINSVVWDTKRYSYHFIDQLVHTISLRKLASNCPFPHHNSWNSSHNNKTISVVQNALQYIRLIFSHRRICGEISVLVALPSYRVFRITVICAQSVERCQQERTRCLISASISIERSRRPRREIRRDIIRLDDLPRTAVRARTN